ncbi:hypothetical protein HY439_03605 [Candidatus Microgenomates bacterium]|nr:hypothetical protein [Candidatus Microgenomates bacterium]
MSLKNPTREDKIAVWEKNVANYTHPVSHWLFVVVKTVFTSGVSILIGFTLLFSGLIFFQMALSWFKFVVGLPLMGVGGSIIVINFYKVLAAVFDRRYSKNNCAFCQKELA